MSDHHAADHAERLGQLLDAVLLVASDLSLATTLERIVAAARDVSGARYAALGVVESDGTLGEFITAGMDADTIDGISHRPEGLGLLGTLIHEPHPLRIAEIGADPRSAGFPAGHPPMHSFLGVPIKVRDRVFGNLYLTEKADGTDFSEDDEAIVIALAAAAGVAVGAAQRRIERMRSRLRAERLLIARRIDGPGTGLVLLGLALLDSGDRPEVRAALPRTDRSAG